MKMSNNETIKRLIKSASLLIRKLDSIVAKALQGSGNLFTAEAIELRSQLTHLCNRSIIADPVQCRRKAEELLWRKCYYEVISAVKLNAKKSPLSIVESFYIESHIDCGIARFSEHLHNTWSKLRQIEGILIPFDHILPLENISKEHLKSCEAKEDLLESVQRILVWLGDLSRYKYDLGISENLIIAHRFYQQAIIVNPSNGLPFNQLGTLTGHDDSRTVEAIFYYTRSIVAPKAFNGAESNLKNLLDRLSGNDNSLVSSFAQLVFKLALNHKDENAYEIAQLCQANLSEIQSQLLNDGNVSHILLNMTAVVVTFTSQTSRVSKSQSTTAGIAFCCSLFLHIINKFVRFFSPEDERSSTNPIEENRQSDVEVESDEEQEELKRARMRRRKIGSDSDDQEFSDEEFFLNSVSDDDSDEEVLSDSGFHSAEAKPNVVCQPDLSKSLTEIPAELSSLFAVMKLLADWFQINSNVVHVSSQSVTEMWSALAIVLNGLKCYRPNDEAQPYQRHPLEEDWKFYGFEAMSSIHSQLDFNRTAVCNSIEIENALRVERILQFGVWLSENAAESTLKNVDGLFVCQPSQIENEDKTDLMRNMAHLWLKSEVQELERKLVGNPKRKKKADHHLANLPYVYVVIDAAVLTDFTPLLKKIVKSQKLIVVIPDVVISEMDQLKKENQGIRDCIRWLETCFRNGDRFIRAQRQNEHQTIPLITYPKRKDKITWNVFQILECCHFLDSQQRNKNDQNSPVVMFLVGQLKEGTDQNIKGICASIGVDLRTAESLNIKNKAK